MFLGLKILFPTDSGVVQFGPGVPGSVRRQTGRMLHRPTGRCVEMLASETRDEFLSRGYKQMVVESQTRLLELCAPRGARCL